MQEYVSIVLLCACALKHRSDNTHEDESRRAARREKYGWMLPEFGKGIGHDEMPSMESSYAKPGSFEAMADAEKKMQKEDSCSAQNACSPRAACMDGDVVQSMSP